MPKGPNGQMRPADFVRSAVHIAKIAIGEIEDTELKQLAKRAIGLAGAKARQDGATEAQRSAIARKAAAERWS